MAEICRAEGMIQGFPTHGPGSASFGENVLEVIPVPEYVRYHVGYASPKTNHPVGVFVAVWHLVRSNYLTDDEVREYWDIRRYTERVLPIPPFYDDRNTMGAITWFKDNAEVENLLLECDFYFRTLKKYGVEVTMSRTANPGRIIYEDRYQVGVLSRDR